MGFCGAVGSGIKSLVGITGERLESLGYTKIIHIRVSDIMQKIFHEWEDNPLDISTPYLRYKNLQDFGNSLRKSYYKHILAEAVISEISIEKKLLESDIDYNQQTSRVAFLIDQLKHPAEIELLRIVYQHNFYLIGVIRSENERKRNLRDEDISKSEIDEIIHRDRKGLESYEQQTAKAILDADYFIKNNQGQKTHLEYKIKRVINLIHGVNGITPTLNEKGLYAAFSASLQSACLSRQVGAAILDDLGNLLATGKNDVPKFGGGLYTADDGINDHRCVFKGGKCYNDFRKKGIKEKIERILSSDEMSEKKIILDKDQIKFLADKLIRDTPISSIIEYSRSIHAEMDAITSMARLSGKSTLNTVLYTTTYPCHNCARHIVASGIKKVVYIEPYEKSLALDLHDDAITEINEKEKVIFDGFEGVSPRRYQKFFFPTDERKNNDGIANKTNAKYGNHIDMQFLDSYLDFEKRISDIFTDRVKKPEP
ncbi:anti-phage dCTP deaminase [Pectobacterium aquaticum]|uniref:anti-phage dCTP deaminase n=1 Tax=Pectobacterium aquaticum TaxID=2204145 RepID=UPI0021F751F9|nr:anti-phage dCTP deaminase [Pectobacterium aquaticum]